MIRQQVEGAAGMGVSLSFYGEITATNGAIDQSNFDGFQMARINNAPRDTNTYIVPSDPPPAGNKEGPPPPALFAPRDCIFLDPTTRTPRLAPPYPTPAPPPAPP